MVAVLKWSASGMIEINLANAIKQPGEVFRYEYTGTPELKEIDFAEPISIKAEYSQIDDNGDIRVTGKYRAVINTVCVRCLDNIEYKVEREFDELFSKYVKDDDSYQYAGEDLSLDKMIYDDITLYMPQYILCRDDCKGLCQHCGINLNKETCNCGDEVIENDSNPFGMLKDLF